MSIQGIDHLYVETRHFNRAVAFWNALGFTVASSWGEAGHRACMLVSNAAKVVLAEASPGVDPSKPALHFALADAATMSAALARSPDATVVTPLEATHWGSQWIRVRDPDGNVHVLEAASPNP